MRAKSFVKRPLVVAITLALCSSGSAIAAQAEDNSANGEPLPIIATDSDNIFGQYAGGKAQANSKNPNAISIVNGNTYVSINSKVSLDEEGYFEGVTLGVSGGGLASSVMGTNALSQVNGNAEITIHNGFIMDDGVILPMGVLGGGAALALDEDEYGDVSTSSNRNSIANATIRDTKISLTGTTSGFGVVGGGFARAQYSDAQPSSLDLFAEADSETEEDNNETLTRIEATSEVGNITINVDLANTPNAETIESMKNAHSLSDFVDKNAVFYVVGGGVASASGGDENVSVKATVSNTNSTLNYRRGYIVGSFGGGVAHSEILGEALAQTSGNIVTNIYKDATVVGAYGGGLAFYDRANWVGSQGWAHVVAQNTTMNIDGTVQRVVGGSLAYDDDTFDTSTTINAQTQTTSSTINILANAKISSTFDTFNFGDRDDAFGNLYKDTFEVLSKYAPSVAVASGGVAMGDCVRSEVENATINIKGGEITGDVIGGGIAGFNKEVLDKEKNKINGSYVTNSTINLDGGKIEGNVYAGGASDITGKYYDEKDTVNDDNQFAQTYVEKAVINWTGTEITGQISGKGLVNGEASTADNYEASKVEHSTLNVNGTLTLSPLDNGNKINSMNEVIFTDSARVSVAIDTIDNTHAIIDSSLVDGGRGSITKGKLRLNVEKLIPNTQGKYLIASNYDATKSNLWKGSELAFDRFNYVAFTEESVGDDGKVNGDKYTISYKKKADATDEEKEQAKKDLTESFGNIGESIRDITDNMFDNTEKSNEGAVDLMTDFTTAFENNEHDVIKSLLFGELAGVTSNTVGECKLVCVNSFLQVLGDPLTKLNTKTI